jgi:hypothetical protein
MNRTAVLFALMVALVVTGAHAQAGPAASVPTPTACPPVTTLDELIKALDDAVSGPGNKDRACLRELLLPDARLTPVSKTADGKLAPHHLTVDDWINAVARRGAEPFYERQVKVTTHQYGHIAQLWSEYEICPTPEGAATIRGVNSIQAFYDGSQWKVVAILWEAENTAGAPPGNKP